MTVKENSLVAENILTTKQIWLEKIDFVSSEMTDWLREDCREHFRYCLTTYYGDACHGVIDIGNLGEFLEQKEFEDDVLDRTSEAVANIALPGLSKDKNEITSYYGIEGLNYIRDQIKVSGDLLNKKISEVFFDGKFKNQELIGLTKDGKNITGKIYEIPYLKNFSTKFYKCMKKINRLVAGKKGAKTAFIYSNLVKLGVEVFQEIMIQNGYLLYQEDNDYQLSDNTKCYYCGKTNKYHKMNNQSGGGKKNKEESEESDDSDDSEGYEDSEDIHETNTFSKTSTEYTPRQINNKNKIPQHQFSPAIFVTITGKENDDEQDILADDKRKLLDNVFNKIENKEGKNLKFILGSKVVNEGVSMMNVGEVHILDVYFNLGRVDQVVGRGIRWCSHYKLMNENNIYPYVNVYKYVVSLKNGSLSTEEDLYRKAEHKFILINKLERAMKERALDCPLNVSGNMFNEETLKYEKCENHNQALIKCPSICNFNKCDYKCDDIKLNFEYYDPKRKLYKTIPKNEIDYTTFSYNLAKYEIEYAKKKIKNLYIVGNVYTLHEILDYIKNTYDEERKKLFDEFFVYKALDDFIPVTENDFNNFKDVILDKNNVAGYLIYRDIYYIFQPFNENENVPLYYRTNTANVNYTLSLHSYLKSSENHKLLKDYKNSDIAHIENDIVYNFNDTVEYYDERPENDIVGIVDKELDRKNTKSVNDIKEVFKIRNKMPKNNSKKRGKGIPSTKGSVCYNSKSKKYLLNLAKKLEISIDPKKISSLNRTDICDKIEEKMLENEKYSTGKNKVTYVRIPANHPKYPFPYNLEDRVNYIIDKIKSNSKNVLNIDVKNETKKNKPIYYINIKSNNKEDDDFLTKLGAIKEKNNWVITVE